MEFLKRLCEADGISGREGAVRRIIRDEMTGMVDDITVDAMGSIICLKKGAPAAARKKKQPARKVMLSGHIDEIGFIVNHVEDDGWIRILPIGGWDPRNLLSQRVMVHTVSGKSIRGVIGTQPIHILPKEKAGAKLEIQDLFIDLGLPGKKVKKLVQMGDWVTMDRGFVEVGDCYVSKAFDDRVGAYVIFEALKAARSHEADIYAVGTVQEEVGLRGASTAAFGIDPDIAVAVDITLACDIPGAAAQKRITSLGEGVAIKIMDASLICNPGLVEFFTSLAKKNRIKHQMEILPRGGTDAGAMQRARTGCPAITISIPTRYGHSPVEMIHKSDLKAAVRLLTRFIETAHTGNFMPE